MTIQKDIRNKAIGVGLIGWAVAGFAGAVAGAVIPGLFADLTAGFLVMITGALEVLYGGYLVNKKWDSDKDVSIGAGLMIAGLLGFGGGYFGPQLTPI